MDEKIVSDAHAAIQPPILTQTPFPQAMAARADSPSRRGTKVQSIPNMTKSDDLEELDEDEEADEIVQEVEPPIEDSDVLTDTGGPTPQLWAMDWGDLDQERRNYRKRPALDDLPDEVREELASMSGAESEIRPKQKPKLEPPDTVKETTRGRKSPADEEGTAGISVLLTKPAKTAEERLDVLEARDKLIRIRSNQQRSPQLKNVGKCPDMCPEKERYQRIARHQVDYYEYNRETKEVNHACMIKIYARSSADQQMPLPHDLRPVNVLWVTMSYLVSQFMDLADSPGENLGEWYHFLWDRMRSIRKDITQLALCDTVSVQILEMCARFHIFCMERLREEKMAVFDEKINRENLTKCLQSLQYMYNDLFLKNVSCPNEPEFQAYSILLHINSDLCTSTILGLRSEMRQHEKVKFAINAFLAVTMKNYVRFFKLVKSTTYLNACILHQYFAQVRAHAMHSIIRAYSRQKMRNTYPLSELQGQLLFDSIDDVLEFCRFSKVPVEESNIVLEKNTAHPIPMQEKMKRSFVGVECKRQNSIREIVAGGCHIANTATYHKVHDSFDDQGILKQEAWYAEDQDASVLSLEVQDAGILPSTRTVTGNTHGSIHTKSDSRGSSPLREMFSSIPTPLLVATQSNMPLTQNSDATVSQKSVFGVSKISASSSSSEFSTHKSEDLSSILTPVTDTTVSHVDVQNSASDLISTKGVSSHSLLALGQPSVDTKSFVFRLPDTKLESKDSHQKQSATTGSMQSGVMLHTTPSIFGGSSSTTGNRSPGASVLRMASSGHSTFTTHQAAQSTSSGYWSLSQPLIPVTCMQNLGDILSPMETSTPDTVVSYQSKSPGFSFKTIVSSSTMERPLQFPGFFIPGRTDFWGTNNTKPVKESVGPFVSAPFPTSYFSAATTSATEKFSPSVYGLISQPLSESTDTVQMDEPVIGITSIQSPFSHEPAGFSSSTDFSQQMSHASHISPLHGPPRAVTVPTSIFGLHSRPLTTPQMFPTSVSPSSITVSPHTTTSTPASPPGSTSITESHDVSKALPRAGGFLFPPGKNTTLPISSSHPALALPSLPTHQISMIDTAPTTERPFQDVSQVIGCAESHVSSSVDEMEVDSDDDDHDDDDDDDDDELTDRFTLKSDQRKPRSPVVRSFPPPLLSPSCASDLKRVSVPHMSTVTLQKVDENKKLRIREMVSEIFRQWRLLTYRAKLKRRLQSQDMCVPLGTSLSLEEQVHELPIPQGCVAIDFRTRLEYLLDVEEIKIPQPVFPDIGKLKLENILRNILPKALADKGKFESNMFWKLYISLPDESEGKKYSVQLCEWVDATFSDDNEEQESQKELLRVTRTHLGEEYNLFTSVQRTIGSEHDTLKGVNGLYFFLPRTLANIKNSYDRYQRMVDASLVHFPLPVVAVITNPQWVDICRVWFISDIEKERIEAFKIILPFQETKENASQELTDGISWLTQYVSPAPPFERWPLREVLLNLMTDLWTRVRFSLAIRCSSGCHQHPEDLLNLYHDALKHLNNIVVNDQLDKYGDNAPELETLAKNSLGSEYISRAVLKNPVFIKKIKEGFVNFQINVKVPSIETLSVESFCESVCSYNPGLRGPISHFLCQWDSSGDIDWTHVVEALTEIHIRDTISELKLKNFILIFVKSELDKFRMKPWYILWLQDRFADQTFHVEETQEDSDSNSEVPEPDSCLSCSDIVATELTDPDEKLLSDFECMLNELERMNKGALLTADFNCSLSSQSLDICDKDKHVELDILESKLEKYAELLID